MDIQLYVNTDNLEIMGDFARRFDSEKEMFIYDIGSIQIGQDKDIIMHAKNPELTFEYYYTYVIGSVRHQVKLLSIIRKFLMYVHWKQTQ